MPAVQKLKGSGRFRVRWRDAAGNRVSPGFSFPTETMARNYGLDREAEIRRGEYRDPAGGRLLLKDWVVQWQQARVAEDRTIGKEKGHLDKYVLAGVGDAKALGDLRLEQLDEMTVQAWVRRLEKQGLAPATVTSIYRTLAAVLAPAVRARRIQADPLRDITLPTLPPADDFHWTREQTAAIRAEITDPLDRALFELLLGTGMRWGEAVGLHLPRWQPLRRRVTVAEVVVERGGFRLKQYPKGKHRREIPVLGQELVDAMAAHLATTPPVSCGLDHGKGKSCPGLLFHRGAGKPLSRHVWPRAVFTPAVTAAKAPAGTVHDLRHTFATWLVMDGVPLRVVQELLGHASARTSERYAHFAPSGLEDPRLVASLRGVAQTVAHEVTA